jgi:phosphoglycerate dehydrogenase-like enzyme
LALMLAVLRRTIELDSSVRRGEWNRTGSHTPRSLTGATVGLVGFGRTGRLVARRLRGFAVELLVNDVVSPGDDSVRAVGLDELLARSDVVSLHVPLVASTRHLIGARELASMRPSAILVNCSRGEIVDEQALAAALDEGRLRGAGLDVFDREPPRSSPLLLFPQVVLSPHIAGLSENSIEEMTRRATESVIAVLGGHPPEYLVNPEVLEHPRFRPPATAIT